MRHHQTEALRAVYLITRDRASAEDIVQTAFVRAYQRIEQFDDNRSFRPWFLRSVVNDALKMIGRQQRQISWAEVVAEAEVALDDGLTDDRPGPAEIAEMVDTRQKIWAALGKLTPIQRLSANADPLHLQTSVPTASLVSPDNPPQPADAYTASLNHGIQVNPTGDMVANINHLKTLGLEWVKFQMAWKEVEPSPGEYQWAGWDEVIKAYAANNIKVLLSIPKAPDWSRPATDDKSVEGLPADPATYANFVTQVAVRYQGQVQAIEIWDEQNLWYKSGGMGRMDAAEYVHLLQSAYQAIKTVNPEMIVVSGGLTPVGNVEEVAVDDVEYLQQMYDNGLKGYFDALGTHPSGYNCPALADWRTVTIAEATATDFLVPFENRARSWCFLGTMQAYRQVMLANDDGDKAMWPTEFGWATSANPTPGYDYVRDNTPQEQAEWIIEAYQWADEQRWVGPMFLWNLDYKLDSNFGELGYFSIIGQPVYDRLAKMKGQE